MTDRNPSSKEYDQPRDYHDGHGGIDKPVQKEPGSSGVMRPFVGLSVTLGVFSIFVAIGYKAEGSEALAADASLLALVLIGWPFVLIGVLALLQALVNLVGGSDE